MYRTKTDLEYIFDNFISTKDAMFTRSFHKDRMKELMQHYPEHYANMSDQELREAKEKEYDIVYNCFLESYGYPLQMSGTGEKFTEDGISEKTIEIMRNGLTSLFYVPSDDIELESKTAILDDFTDIIEITYEMTAQITEHVRDAGNYEEFYKSSSNKNRVVPSIQTQAKKLMNLLDNHGVSSPNNDKTYLALEDLCKNTHDYLFPKYTFMTPSLKVQYLQHLTKYLNSLLQNKQDQINTFTTSLIKDIQRAYSVKTNKVKITNQI